ncbi:MAG TPA: acetyl-CoA carboxylase biotin carboxylase subunit [Planctomycetota bacterium]|nr:acetyl-CoA carboxylase biotin carboxylase subunit [Planctomycetota bacterium]
MFSRILIANRGEIALRVIRACRELGVQSVVVYSEVDRNAAYLRCADEAICIGAGPAADSYLNIPRIISAAEIANVDAIHPGYGFLSENAHFAEVCESCKIKFIGPSSKVLAKMGNKVEARNLAKQNKVPVVPGSEGPVETENDALKTAHEIGFPVMLKAAGGGGGRGMRVAHNDISLVKAFFAARSEAQAAFKDPTLYIEKYIEHPRHVEIQVLGDEYGNIVHLGERDCSLQRRHQKLVEESPSPVVSTSLRESMGKAAVRLARTAGYFNAGTVEFLMDKDNHFYFIEVNARIQVEHPVTEMVTGVDLVKQQICIASGDKLRLRQRRVEMKGVAIECRINAEDPTNGYAPSPGIIETWIPPGGNGVRLDTHAYAGYEVPSEYDSLIGKLIVHKPTRQEAIACMRRALDEFVIHGVKTTIPLHIELFGHSRYIRGNVDTSFVENLVSRG